MQISSILLVKRTWGGSWSRARIADCLAAVFSSSVEEKKLYFSRKIYFERRLLLVHKTLFLPIVTIKNHHTVLIGNKKLWLYTKASFWINFLLLNSFSYNLIFIFWNSRSSLTTILNRQRKDTLATCMNLETKRSRSLKPKELKLFAEMAVPSRFGYGNGSLNFEISLFYELIVKLWSIGITEE